MEWVRGEEGNDEATRALERSESLARDGAWNFRDGPSEWYEHVCTPEEVFISQRGG